MIYRSPTLPLLGARSWYSLLDGARSPCDLARAAAALGYPALALADANNFYALPELVDEARSAGVKALAAASIEVRGLSFRAYCLDRRGFARGTVNGQPSGFIHGTGHGVGLEVHEAPGIGRAPSPCGPGTW